MRKRGGKGGTEDGEGGKEGGKGGTEDGEGGKEGRDTVGSQKGSDGRTGRGLREMGRLEYKKKC